MIIGCKIYKNLGNSKREGMFLYGYLPYINSDGKQDTVEVTKVLIPYFSRPGGYVPRCKAGNKILQIRNRI